MSDVITVKLKMLVCIYALTYTCTHAHAHAVLQSRAHACVQMCTRSRTHLRVQRTGRMKEEGMRNVGGGENGPVCVFREGKGTVQIKSNIEIVDLLEQTFRGQT